ncbi:MAG: hypothetical protein LBD45_02980 [Bacteroidales bacterium]|jgi:hypothetical protein|nr:hypothetical protein [Bacteroidales bacterium]
MKINKVIKTVALCVVSLSVTVAYADGYRPFAKKSPFETGSASKQREADHKTFIPKKRHNDNGHSVNSFSDRNKSTSDGILKKESSDKLLAADVDNGDMTDPNGKGPGIGAVPLDEPWLFLTSAPLAYLIAHIGKKRMSIE